jgi:NTP pyrophosphatase (non-canonical NTP hydrolase)
MNLKNEFEPIRDWAKEKGILEGGDMKTQALKLMEEAGELAKAILTSNTPEIVDAIGDCVVVLTNLAALANRDYMNGDLPYDEDVNTVLSYSLEHNDYPKAITIESCLNSAYHVIAKRTGKMVGGSFVKDAE